MFTDAGIQYIGEELKEKMKSADYAGTFFGFADLCDRFTDQAKKDRPYDTSNLPIKPLSFKYIPISLGIGLVIALIAVSVMKSKLKTVRYKAEANSYVRPGSMNITVSRDLFPLPHGCSFSKAEKQRRFGRRKQHAHILLGFHPRRGRRKLLNKMHADP